MFPSRSCARTVRRKLLACSCARIVRRALLACSCALLLCALVWSWLDNAPREGPATRNLPLRYWTHRNYYSNLYSQSGCVSCPGPRDVQSDVPLWQRVTDDVAASARVLVFAAHWDARATPRVRVLAHSASAPPDMRCLFWYFDSGDPLSVSARLWTRADSGGGGGGGALRVLTCVPPVPPAASVAPATLAAVSLVPVDFDCGTPDNILRIQGLPSSDDSSGEGLPEGSWRRRRQRPTGAVCAVWRRRADDDAGAGARLAEWLTALHHFGVSTVFLYMNDAHRNVLRVVERFSWPGAFSLVEVTAYSPPKPPPAPRRAPRDLLTLQINERDDENKTFHIHSDDLLPYNDCLYRALHKRFVWLALLDLDEIIVPLRDETWGQLGVRVSREAVGAGAALPDVLAPKQFWFPAQLQRDVTPARAQVPPTRLFSYKWRAPIPRDPVGVTGKLLRVTSIVHISSTQVYCHLGDCSVWNVDTNLARLHEYTARCGRAAPAVCRALGPLAVRDNELSERWPLAKQHAQVILRELQLGPQNYEYTDIDDE